MPRRNCKLPAFTPQDIENFWSKVDKTPGQGPRGECWGWIAGRDGDGYGKIGVSDHRRTVRSHRMAYFLATREDPGPLDVCHRCDWPPCCNGAHLFLGTPLDNNRDSKAKGRNCTGDDQWLRKFPERVRKGTAHHSARLSEEDVRTIRARYSDAPTKHGVMTALAREYAVEVTTIFKIVKRLRWKHVS